MCTINTEDVGGESCEPVGGINIDIYYALRSDFETVIDPPAFGAAGTYATKAAIATAHTFKPGKGFNKITVASKTGTIKSTGSGERKRKGFTNEFVGQIQGSEAVVLGFMRMVKNADYIVLAEEAGSGRLRQLGSSRSFAEFTALEHSIEADMLGNNACTFTIQDTQLWPAPIYSGTVTQEPQA
jgi:hypothetical protein